VLVGAEKVSHIEDNIAALNNLDFTTEELSQIDLILKS
jgi:L-glyceraldehyde 3-phosphate reductase